MLLIKELKLAINSGMEAALICGDYGLKVSSIFKKYWSFNICGIKMGVAE